jgi:DNA polymerase III, epsilon subunit and related 3''-5'' exonucleases
MNSLRVKEKNNEPNQTNCISNFVYDKSNVSSNWKNFKQNSLHLKKSENSGDIKKSDYKKFRNVKRENPRNPKSSNSQTKRHLNQNSKELTKAIAIDCEMVGIDTGKDNMLARVSLVNKHGNCIYDKYVLPSEPVVDYRTSVSGIRPKDLRNGEPFETVQKEVAEILRNKTLVGHALRNDLKVLYLSHPKKAIRDTSRYKRFRQITNGRTPSLRKLADELLGVKIQQGEHDSVVDARTAMQLYLLYKNQWEKDIHSKHIRLKQTL